MTSHPALSLSLLYALPFPSFFFTLFGCCNHGSKSSWWSWIGTIRFSHSKTLPVSRLYPVKRTVARSSVERTIHSRESVWVTWRTLPTLFPAVRSFFFPFLYTSILFQKNNSLFLISHASKSCLERETHAKCVLFFFFSAGLDQTHAEWKNNTFY